MSALQSLPVGPSWRAARDLLRGPPRVSPLATVNLLARPKPSEVAVAPHLTRPLDRLTKEPTELPDLRRNVDALSHAHDAAAEACP